jgi:hypothetical protein
MVASSVVPSSALSSVAVPRHYPGTTGAADKNTLGQVADGDMTGVHQVGEDGPQLVGATGVTGGALFPALSPIGSLCLPTGAMGEEPLFRTGRATGIPPGPPTPTCPTNGSVVSGVFVGDVVGDHVGSLVGKGTGVSVEELVGAAVGALVGVEGTALGAGVEGAELGSSVGNPEWIIVGLSEGTCEGTLVGAFVVGVMLGVIETEGANKSDSFPVGRVSDCIGDRVGANDVYCDGGKVKSGISPGMWHSLAQNMSLISWP